MFDKKMICSPRVFLSGSHVILNVAKNLAVLCTIICAFWGCSDYEQMLEDDYGFLRASSVPSNIVYDTMIDGRDGKVYKTVVIGSQTWMAQNLNFDYNIGSSRSYCWNDNEDFCDVFGRLYLWSAAMDSAALFSSSAAGCGRGKSCVYNASGASSNFRGVCPEGWHLPSDHEWSVLAEFLGGWENAGVKLKSLISWREDGMGTDDYGFSGLPAGKFYAEDGEYKPMDGCYAGFWTSTEYGVKNAYGWFLTCDPSLWRDVGDKQHGFSIRCLKD